MFSGPTISAATSAMNFTASLSFTSGGKTTRTSALALPPRLAAIPLEIVSIRSLMSAIVSLRKARIVPRSTASCGITL